MTGQHDLPTTLKIGPPTLRVKNLVKSLHFYEKTLGLRTNSRHKDPVDALEIVELGFGGTFDNALDPLLILKHDSDAKESAHNFAGLFHFAILVPDRKSLAVAYSALERNQIRFDGFADHVVSESLYLHDPERNGIEIYRDRPTGEWTHDAKGRVVMDTLPLDLKGMLSELTGQNRNVSDTFPSGARIGHVHLRVTDLRQSTKFYQEKLGLHVSADWSQMGAMFLSAGSYHHHLGLNVWHSLNGTKREGGELGLDEFPISFSDYSPPLESNLVKTQHKGKKENEYMLTDPDGIRLAISSSK